VNGQRSIALFDYDNTLVKGDSLWPFLVAVAGKGRACFTLLTALAGWPLVWLKRGDTRTHVKAVLLKKILGGKHVSDLAAAVGKMRSWPREKEPAASAIKDHHAKGHHIVIASGGLDLYLPHLLEHTPHDALICTMMEVVDGVVTGKMTHGNCVRALKADLIQAYLDANGPFDDSWGYGNAPHDLPMLVLVKHRIVVK
jgi:HAD superfamily hydrolase (TIGR01490 family)